MTNEFETEHIIIASIPKYDWSKIDQPETDKEA